LTTLVAHDGFLLTDGQLQIHLTERDGSWMRRNFASLLRAARHLVMDEGRAARFLGNYKAEKNPLIALRNAVFLLRDEAGSPEAAEVTELLLHEGAQRFLGLGDSPEWPGVLATLAMRRPERGASLIEGFLERQLHPGQSVHEGGLAKIAVVLGGLKASVARPLIWRVLDSAPPGSVRVMAVTSLGRVGEVADVERLRALSSGVFGAQLGGVIDDAVAAIQGRVETGEGGGLALMEEADDAGGLSVAAEEGGLSKPGGVEQP
jgi:hypothetical protein